MISLGENRYGKSRVRLLKVERAGSQHRVLEWSVEIWLTGDFASCFREGDNSRILPTDTMKNTVYSLARGSSALTMEEFATELVTYFLATQSQVESADVRIKGTHWEPIKAGGNHSDTAFIQTGPGVDTARVQQIRGGRLQVVGGLEGVTILKTAKSAFSGFKRNRLTTLKETEDRLLGTTLCAEWNYAATPTSYVAARAVVRDALLQTFAGHDSKSVQQTLYAMAESALEKSPDLEEIWLSMPNKHCNLVDLSAFGQDNPNHIFVPTDEPHGSIEARVRRRD